MVIDVSPGAEVPNPVDARDAQSIIEMKFDEVVERRRPKFEEVGSTYAASLTSKTSRLTPHEQILEYNCFALAAQGPIRHHMLGLLITCMRIQIMYTDRTGCMISEERNFSRDFSLLFAVLIGIYRSEAQQAALQSAITPLSTPDGTPLKMSDFDASDREVQTGSTTNISRPIQPFQTLVQLASASAEDVIVYAHGVNLMERPMAISEETAPLPNITAQAALRTRPSISRLAKSKALEKNRGIAVSQLGQTARRPGGLSRQFAPRSIFGSGMARYRCVLEASLLGNADLTLQLSWQPKGRLSEASVLRLANEYGVPGVPTLIGSGDIADTDESFLRSSLQQAFPEIPRPHPKVLRALVWQEDCIPLSSVNIVDDFLAASQSILRSTSQILCHKIQVLT